MSLALAKESYARRERKADRRIPYDRVLDPYVTRLRQGGYVAGVIKLRGAPFQSADGAMILDWEDRLNKLWVSLASPELAIWSTLVHRRNNTYPDGRFPPGFAASLNDKCRQNVAQRDLWTNDLYLSFIQLPDTSGIERAAAFTLRTVGRDAAARQQREAMEACERLRDDLMQSLALYSPTVLGTVVRDGAACFEPRGLFGFLLNGVWEHAGVPSGAMNRVLTTSQTIIGEEAIEYRTADQTRYGAMLGIADYPSRAKPDMFAPLLCEAPFPFVLTQSFHYIDRAKAVDAVRLESRIMVKSGDFSAKEADDMVEAVVYDLQNNQLAAGRSHFSLQVQTDFFDGIRESDEVERDRQRQLSRNVGLARKLLRGAGIQSAREGKAILEASYFAQLPGNLEYRPRLADINTLDWSSFVSLHGLPRGQKLGWWGPALMALVTEARTLYYYGPHVRDVGHKIIFGPTGSGKSTFLGYEVAMLQKVPDCTVAVLDFKQSLRIVITRLGGVYQAIRNGVRTGQNPLQAEPTPGEVEHMRHWLRRLVYRPGRTLTPAQDENLENALRATLSEDVPREERRLSVLIGYTRNNEEDGLSALLAPWCECEGGEYAWVFDNPRDEMLGLAQGSTRLVGWDLTDVIDNPMVRDPITMNLWHRVESLADGRKLAVYVEEANKIFAYEYNARRCARALELWRGLNAMLTLCMQQTSHALEVPIVARAAIEQCLTKAFYANPSASEDEYTSPDKFGRSHREFHIIKHVLEPREHKFLMCQDKDSIVCSLPLSGDDFEYERAVLSSNPKSIAKMLALQAEYGEAVHQWEPPFREWVGSADFKEK